MSVKNLEDSWDEEAERILIESINEGYSSSEVVKLLKNKGFSKSRNAVCAKLDRMSKSNKGLIKINRINMPQPNVNSIEAAVKIHLSQRQKENSVSAYKDVYSLKNNECKFIVDIENYEKCNDSKPINGQEYYCKQTIHKGSYCEKHSDLCYDKSRKLKYMFKN